MSEVRDTALPHDEPGPLQMQREDLQGSVQRDFGNRVPFA